MSDEHRDDEVLGRALARAIETIDVNETPYERSRVATAPARRRFPLWQLGAAAAAVLFAVALGSWFTRATVGQPGVTASPSASPAGATPSPTTSPPAVASPSQDRIWVYFARDGLPPIGAFVRDSKKFLAGSPESRIASRITALGSAAAVTTGTSEVPTGATTALTLDASRGIAVRVQGDLATVEFDNPTGWGVRGATQSQALVQQLVYTITEEPRIRRAFITERGKPNAVVDQFVIDKPLSREDVAGYATLAPTKIEDAGTGVVADIVDWRASVDDVAPGLGRFVVELKPQTATQNPPMPRFAATLERPTQEKTVDDGKWILRVALPDAVWNQARGEAFHCCPLKAVDRTPIRQVAAYPLTADPPTGNGAYRGIGFAVTLDDARPWRVAVLQNPLRLILDVGGAPQSVSDSVAVYLPGQGYPALPRFTVSGLARTFEAGILWRVRDGQGRIVVNGSATATPGTIEQWGTFQFDVQLPPSRAGTGDLFLEVYWMSPKDGTDQGLVRVHLKVG